MTATYENWHPYKAIERTREALMTSHFTDEEQDAYRAHFHNKPAARPKLTDDEREFYNEARQLQCSAGNFRHLINGHTMTCAHCGIRAEQLIHRKAAA